jgi:putative addiction module component (TIGR02574 family)
MSSGLKIPAEFDSASSDERIAFVQELWDRIARDEHGVQVPLEHDAALRERLAAYRTNPEPGVAWSKVRDELIGKSQGP